MENELTILELSTEEADLWIKKLYAAGGELLHNIDSAFCEENDKRPPCALPSPVRRYFMVYADGKPELLASINISLNVSSLAKVVLKCDSRVRGRDCVRKFLEDIVVNECRKYGKSTFSVNTWASPGGRGVFEHLMDHAPNGVENIIPTQWGFTLYIYP